MSNMVSPRGPLPPKVYWRRRLLLLAVVVGAVALVGRVVTGGDGTEAMAEKGPAQQPAGTPSATASGGPQSTPTPGEAEPTDGQDPTSGPTQSPEPRSSQAAARAAEDASRAAMLSGPDGPLAPAQGACAASDVVVVPDVEDTDAYGPVPVRLGLSATGGSACTFTFGPDTVALQITSGDDLIWQSLSCSTVLEEQSVVVRPGWLTYVTVDWTGRRSSSGCGGGNAFAEPGYYWAEAAALGGEPKRSQFELETPPKPEPKKKPGKKKSADDEKRDRTQQRADENNRENNREDDRRNGDGDQGQNDENSQDRQSRQGDNGGNDAQ